MNQPELKPTLNSLSPTQQPLMGMAANIPSAYPWGTEYYLTLKVDDVKLYAAKGKKYFYFTKDVRAAYIFASTDNDLKFKTYNKAELMDSKCWELCGDIFVYNDEYFVEGLLKTTNTHTGRTRIRKTRQTIKIKKINDSLYPHIPIGQKLSFSDWIFLAYELDNFLSTIPDYDKAVYEPVEPIPNEFLPNLVINQEHNWN